MNSNVYGVVAFVWLRANEMISLCQFPVMLYWSTKVYRRASIHTPYAFRKEKESVRGWNMLLLMETPISEPSTCFKSVAGAT